MSYLVITKISKDKEFFADLSDFADKVNSIKTPEVDLILDNAVLTGDLLSRTYGFQEEATEYLAVVSSNWLSEDVYENYRAKDDSKQQAVEFEEKGYAFETILP